MTRNSTATKATLISVLVLCATLVPLSGALDDYGVETSDDSEALPVFAVPLIAGLLAGGGGLGAGWAIWGNGHSHSPDTNQEYADATNAVHYADWLNALLNGVENGVAIDSQVLLLTQMYWSRSAEVVAADLWSEGSDINQYKDRILTDSTFTPNIENLYRSWESLVDQPFDSMAQWPSDSADKGYNVAFGFYVGEDRIPTSKTLRYDSGTYADPTSGADRVYLATTGSESTGGLSTLYVLGSYGVLTDQNGNSHKLTNGKYGISEFAPGYYRLSGGPFVGPFTPAGSNAAELSGAFVQISDDSVHYLYADSDIVYYDGTSVPEVGIYASYEEGGETKEIKSSVTTMLKNWSSLISSIQTMASKTITAATAQWLLFDSVGSANPLSSLSMYLPDLENLTLTAEQQYLVGLLCMQRNHEWYSGHDVQIQPTDVSITAESLQLFVRGSVKDESGRTIVSDAVYTPLGWSRDVRLAAGETTMWNQQGFAVVWTDDAENWDGKADINTMKLVPLYSGVTLSVDSVTYAGHEVPAMTLQVKNIDLVLSDFEKPPLPEPPAKHPYAQLVMIVLCVSGALVAALSLRSLNPVGVILGSVLIAIGWFFPETVSDIITGDFRFFPNPGGLFGGLFR